MFRTTESFQSKDKYQRMLKSHQSFILTISDVFARTLIQPRSISLIINFSPSLFPGKSSRSEDTDDQHVTRRKKASTSICFKVPAAGLGSRPPSIISSTNTTDEGGFNEPSPEIQAKLKPAYDFDIVAPELPASPPRRSANIAGAAAAIRDSEAVLEPLVSEEEPQLNYADLGYRLRPDGTECDEIYGEVDRYQSANSSSIITNINNNNQPLDLGHGTSSVESRNAINNIRSQYNTNNNQLPEMIVSNGGSIIDGDDLPMAEMDRVLYASIVPKATGDSSSTIASSELAFIDLEKDEAKILDCDELSEGEKGYHSPQTILDPTRATLTEYEDDYSNKTLPDPPSLASLRPPPIPEGPPLDLQDVQYADASDNEHDSLVLPDEMTADEAERLLSSRYVFRLRNASHSLSPS